MKILALDSSGLVASVAVLDGDTIQSEYTMNYKKTHSQTLLPMLEAVKELTDLDLSTIDAIAVAAGPGSFTGLRIGSATAKGLGLALNTPIISVPTLEGLAYIFYGSDIYPAFHVVNQFFVDFPREVHGRLGDVYPGDERLIELLVKERYHHASSASDVEDAVGGHLRKIGQCPLG